MRIEYDTELDRPGCTLLQAAYGGSVGIETRFPTDSWLLFPTRALKVYEVTEEQLQALLARTQRLDDERRET